MGRKPPRRPTETPSRRPRTRPGFERDRGEAQGNKHRGGSPAHRGRPAPGAPEGGRRPRAGENWIYGHHAVIAVLANPARRIERLVVTREAGEIIAKAGLARRVPTEIASGLDIAALLPEGAVHQGFAVRAAPLPERHIEDLLAALPEGASALVVVLDQVTDPRNVGAILRSAAAFGAIAVIQPERHGADVTAALAKAASGALETVALLRVTNIARTLETLKGAGFWCVGLDARAPQALAEVDLTGRIALVLGSEGAGLRRLVADTCDLRARLPIGPGMESLNVAAAAAIALYEAARRRG